MLNPSLTRRLTAAILIAALAATLWGVQLAAAGAAGNPPASPENVLAHLIVPQEGEPRIRVSWDPPAGGQPTGYAITRSDGAAHDVAATATTHSDYNIIPGTSYTYTVSARGDGTTGPASGPATVAVPAAPSAPGELAAEAPAPALQDTSATVSLTWKPATAPQADRCAEHFPVTGYTVHRTAGDDEELLAALGPDDGEYTDADAGFGTGYSYRVTATSGLGNGPASTVNITTPARPVGTPAALTASINQDGFDGTVSLKWEAPAEGPAPTGYRVSRAAGSSEAETLVDNHPGTSFKDDTAEAGVSYSYTVQALTADNTGPQSDAAVIEPPAPATSVTASVESGTVNLAWNAPAKGKADTYRIQRMPADGEWTQVAETADTGHTDDTAPADNTYTYRVQHRNSYGGSQWANSNSVTILGVPPKVTDVAAAVSGNDIVVGWGSPSTDTVDTYEVSYGAKDSEDRDQASVTAPATSFTHSDNTEGTTYEYTVRARNAAGNGPWSEPATARRLNIPKPPTGVEAALSGNDIVLSWTAPATGMVDSYQVRSGVSGSEDTATSETAETSFTHEGPAGDTLYSYQVRSKNEAGESAWTDAVTATRLLPPNPPTGVKTSKDDSNIVVTWTAPSTGAVGGYQLEYRQTMTQAWNRESVQAAGTSWTHEEPTPGTTYEYRLRTLNAAGVSEWTQPVQETWYRGAAPPTHLQNFSMGTGLILVLWNRSPTPGTTGYEFRQNIDGGEWTVTDVGTQVHFLIQWNEGESYREYAVRAVTGDQKGDWTATRTLSLTRPSGVRNLKAYSDGRNNIRVRWNHPATGEPARYKVSHTRNGVPSVSVTRQPGYLSTNLVEGFGGEVTYAVTVRALSHSGLTDQAGSTATVTVRTEPEETVWPQEPSALDTDPVDRTTVRLTWNAPAHSTSNISGYRIYRKEVSDGTRLGDDFSHVLVSNTGNAATTYVDHTARPGVRYQYGIAVRRDSTATPLGGLSTKAYGGGT